MCEPAVQRSKQYPRGGRRAGSAARSVTQTNELVSAYTPMDPIEIEERLKMNAKTSQRLTDLPQEV